jgi:hypothetical protein
LGRLNTMMMYLASSEKRNSLGEGEERCYM